MSPLRKSTMTILNNLVEEIKDINSPLNKSQYVQEKFMKLDLNIEAKISKPDKKEELTLDKKEEMTELDENADAEDEEYDSKTPVIGGTTIKLEKALSIGRQKYFK
jgi:hypothetical protein